jgi:hypothetical protein
VPGSYSVRTTDHEGAQPPAPEQPAATDEIPQQMTGALLLGEDSS